MCQRLPKDQPHHRLGFVLPALLMPHLDGEAQALREWKKGRQHLFALK